MSPIRAPLLAAAAILAGLPALAAAQPPGAGWNRDGDRRGEARPDRGAALAPAPQPGQAPDGDGRRFGQPGGFDRGGADPERRAFDGNRQGPGGDAERRGFAGGPDRRFDGDRRGPGAPPPAAYRDRFAGGDPRGGWNDPRGGFGRDWRGDRRYDWQGYRQSHRDLFRGGRYVAPRGWGYGYRPFAIGARLQPSFYARSYWIDDPYAYRLPPAGGRYRWVRYYQDVLLVDLVTGAVADAIPGFFW